MRVLAVAAVLGAIGVGAAIPLVFGDESSSDGRLASAADVQRLLRSGLERYAREYERRPDLVTCRQTAGSYSCEATYVRRGRDEALVSGYDLTIFPLHDPPTPDEREYLR
ncbi:MAG: hypothetical protein ACRDLQ_09590, partial [Solirubrobacterales bacterium]